MNKIVKLTNVFLKNSLSQFGERKNKKANSTIIIYIIAILYLAIVAGGFSYTIIDNLKQIKSTRNVYRNYITSNRNDSTYTNNIFINEFIILFKR